MADPGRATFRYVWGGPLDGAAVSATPETTGGWTWISPGSRRAYSTYRAGRLLHRWSGGRYVWSGHTHARCAECGVFHERQHVVRREGGAPTLERIEACSFCGGRL